MRLSTFLNCSDKFQKFFVDFSAGAVLAWLWTSRLLQGRPGWSCAMPGSTADSCSVSSGGIFHCISNVKADSDPEDDCTALLGVAVLRSSSTTAVACIFLVLLVLCTSSCFRRLSAAREGGPSLSW